MPHCSRALGRQRVDSYSARVARAWETRQVLVDSRRGVTLGGLPPYLVPLGTRRGCSGPPFRSPRSPSEPPKTPLSPAWGPLLGPPREEEAITRLSPPSLRGSCLGRVPRLLERTHRCLIRLSLPSLRGLCLGPVPRLLERTLHRLTRKITPLVRRPSNL